MINQLPIKLLCATFVGALLLVCFSGCETASGTKSTSFAMSTPSTNQWGETETAPPANPGNNMCGSHCTFIAFNNNGQGFFPICANATIMVKVNGTIIPVSQYEVLWRYSALKKGCALNISETDKQHPVVSGKKYVYTLYFKPGFCPTPGATVEFVVSCPASGNPLMNSTTKNRVVN